MEKFEAHGYNASLILDETGVTIKPGTVGMLFGGGSVLSEKHIPYESISGVEFKKGFPYIGQGYLQINTKGEVAAPTGQSSRGTAIDNNLIKFMAGSNNSFEKAALMIKERAK